MGASGKPVLSGSEIEMRLRVLQSRYSYFHSGLGHRFGCRRRTHRRWHAQYRTSATRPERDKFRQDAHHHTVCDLKKRSV